MLLFVNLLMPIKVVVSENTVVVLLIEAVFVVCNELIGKKEVIVPMVILFWRRITVRLKNYM